MIRAIRRVWDRMSIYLPLLMVGMAALGSYWLLRSTPRSDEAQTRRPVKHEPDYYMDQFSLRTFGGQGQLRSEIYGDEAKHYPDTDTLEISQIRLRFFDTKGNLLTARADRAVANGDGTEVQLIGQAVVKKERINKKDKGPASIPVQLTSEFLHAYLDTGQLKSNKPVELTRGENKITADSLSIDEVEQILQLQGRVRGVLQPRVSK